MASLYEIDKELTELLENGFTLSCVDLETGVIDEEKAQAFLEQLPLEREKKVESIALFIKNLESDVDGIDAEIKRLTERKKAKERKAENLKNYLTTSMLAFKENKFETARVVLSFRKSKSVVIENESAIEKKFIKEEIKYSFDKKAIKQAIESGETVPGASIKENQNLQIK